MKILLFGNDHLFCLDISLRLEPGRFSDQQLALEIREHIPHQLVTFRDKQLKLITVFFQLQGFNKFYLILTDHLFPNFW